MISHAINFYLSIRHLLRFTREKIAWRFAVPSLLCAVGSLYAASLVPARMGSLCYLILFLGGLYLTGTVGGREFRWFRRLVVGR